MGHNLEALYSSWNEVTATNPNPEGSEKKAVEYLKGLRILRQDPFEFSLSFIYSTITLTLTILTQYFNLTLSFSLPSPSLSLS
jgi:hypothetical protein